MKLVFDFGSRPIRVIESKDHFRFVQSTEGWTIAETTQTFGPNGDETFAVWDAEGNFMGTVVDFGNLATIVSQIYDKQYRPRPDATPIKPNYTWVIFGKTTDGVNVATFSREVEAPDLETAKQLVRSEIERACVGEDISFYAIHGPFNRRVDGEQKSECTYTNLR